MLSRQNSSIDETGVDEMAVDETGVDEMAVDETGLDELGCYPSCVILPLLTQIRFVCLNMNCAF